MYQFPYAFKWLLIRDLFIIICRHTVPSDYVPGLKDPSSSKPYQIIKYNQQKSINIKHKIIKIYKALPSLYNTRYTPKLLHLTVKYVANDNSENKIDESVHEAMKILRFIKERGI